MDKKHQAVKSEKNISSDISPKEWKTAAYARLSNENNGQDNDRSLQNQIQYIQKFIEANPSLYLTEIYADNGQSGTNFERPEFLRLMEDIRKGRINCIVVKDLSRFGRNYLETGYYLEKIFPMLHVRFLAINDNYDSMDERKQNELLIPIKNIINEIYAKDVGRKVKATYKMKRQTGQIRNGTPPYGYIKNPNCSYLLLADAKTAPYVKTAFALVASGAGISKTARHLTKIGAPTALQRQKELRGTAIENQTWCERSVKRILKNPVYVGATMYKPLDGEESMLLFPNTHEPLVSKELFDKVQKILEEKRASAKKTQANRKQLRESHPDIFQGVFFCAECGRMMKFHRKFQGDTIRYANYSCNSYANVRGSSQNKPVPKCQENYKTISERRVRYSVLRQIKMQFLTGSSLETILQCHRHFNHPKQGMQYAETTDITIVERQAWDDLFPEGLTRELVERFVKRIEFSFDHTLNIMLKSEDGTEHPDNTIKQE